MIYISHKRKELIIKKKNCRILIDKKIIEIKNIRVMIIRKINKIIIQVIMKKA